MDKAVVAEGDRIGSDWIARGADKYSRARMNSRLKGCTIKFVYYEKPCNKINYNVFL